MLGVNIPNDLLAALNQETTKPGALPTKRKQSAASSLTTEPTEQRPQKRRAEQQLGERINNPTWTDSSKP